jgi:hypothetical protein
MEPVNGTAAVFRGGESLGSVRFDFLIEPTGRVTGHVRHLAFLSGQLGRFVPQTFLPIEAGVARDLRLRIGDGRSVDFSVPATDGQIANGRVVNEFTDLADVIRQVALASEHDFSFDISVKAGEGVALTVTLRDADGRLLWYETGTKDALLGSFRAWLMNRRGRTED